MDLRVNLSTMVNQALAGTRQQTDRLAHLQAEASTGKKLQVASDGPADTVALLAAKAQDAHLTGYLANIQGATSTLDAGVAAMRDAGSILSSARQLAIESAQAGNSPEALASMADEVDQMLNRLIDTANTKLGNQYLFAGTAPQTKPFVATTDPQGRPQSVAYQGAADRAGVIIGPERTIQTMFPGSEVFQSVQRGKTVFTGSTGAAPGQGTDNATGQGTLAVRHALTTYAAGSGVSAGASSAAGDTILGPTGAHHLTINDTSGTGAAGTISLDGGPTVAFTSADTNLRVGGAHGEKVFVNTSAITPSFNGTVDITATGTLSTDGGASAQAIDFSSNQVVSNLTTGAVTNVDSSAIRTTGDEHLEYPGTYDAFQTLMTLRDDLRNTAGLSASQQATVLAARVGEVERVQNSVLRSVGMQSASLEHLQSLQSHFGDLQLAARKVATDLEGADLTDVVVQLQAQQNQLQLTLAAVSKVMGVSLLDFLH